MPFLGSETNRARVGPRPTHSVRIDRKGKANTVEIEREQGSQKRLKTAKRSLTELKKGDNECNDLLDLETDHPMNKILFRLADSSFLPQTTVGKKLKSH